MSPHDSYDTIGAILNIHAMIHGFLIEAVEDVPESRMAEQPGTIVNHPAWTLSHLNAYAGVLLSMLDDPSVPGGAADAEMERFGYGTTPVPDRAAYATKRELLDRFRERNARLPRSSPRSTRTTSRGLRRRSTGLTRRPSGTSPSRCL
jgi:hypothetical protein